MGEAFEAPSAITCAHFSMDGTRLAAGCQNGQVMLLDAESGAVLMPPLETRGSVHSVRFSPDNAKLVATGDDGTAMIWDGATGRALAPTLMHDAAVWFAPSPDALSPVTRRSDMRQS